MTEQVILEIMLVIITASTVALLFLWAKTTRDLVEVRVDRAGLKVDLDFNREQLARTKDMLEAERERRREAENRHSQHLNELLQNLEASNEVEQQAHEAAMLREMRATPPIREVIQYLDPETMEVVEREVGEDRSPTFWERLDS